MTTRRRDLDLARRAAAMVKAMACEDALAVNVLAPQSSEAMERLWGLDPLAAAVIEADDSDDRRLSMHLARVAVAVADSAGMSRGELVRLVDGWLAV